LSLEPSSTTISSKRTSLCASTDWIASTTIGRRLKVGMMTLTSRDIGWPRDDLPFHQIGRTFVLCLQIGSLAAGRKNPAAQEVDALAGVDGAQNRLGLKGAHPGKRGGSLGALELVALGGDREQRQSSLARRSGQLQLLPLRPASRVDQKNQTLQVAPPGQEFTHRASDSRGYRLRHLRVPVAGEIDQRDRFTEGEEIDRLGATRRAAGTRRPAAAGERVQQRAFTHVRPPDDGDLDAIPARAVGECPSGRDKLSGKAIHGRGDSGSGFDARW